MHSYSNSYINRPGLACLITKPPNTHIWFALGLCRGSVGRVRPQPWGPVFENNVGPRRRLRAAHGLQRQPAPLPAAALGARAWSWRGQVRHRLAIGQSTGETWIDPPSRPWHPWTLVDEVRSCDQRFGPLILEKSVNPPEVGGWAKEILRIQYPKGALYCVVSQNLTAQ